MTFMIIVSPQSDETNAFVPQENSRPPNSGEGSRGSEHFYKEQLRPSPPRQYCSHPEYLSRLLRFRRRPLPSDLCRSAVSAPMDLI